MATIIIDGIAYNAEFKIAVTIAPESQKEIECILDSDMPAAVSFVGRIYRGGTRSDGGVELNIHPAIL